MQPDRQSYYARVLSRDRQSPRPGYYPPSQLPLRRRTAYVLRGHQLNKAALALLPPQLSVKTQVYWKFLLGRGLAGPQVASLRAGDVLRLWPCSYRIGRNPARELQRNTCAET